MINFDTWTDYVPYPEEGDTANIGTGTVQFMATGPDVREATDNGLVKLRWRNDLIGEGEMVTYYGYRRPIPERYFATPEQLEEWILSAAQEFCSEYEYYPLSWGFYTEERKKDKPEDEVIGADPVVDPVKGAGGIKDEPVDVSPVEAADVEGKI